MPLAYLAAAIVFAGLAGLAIIFGSSPIDLVGVVMAAISVMCLGEFLLRWQRHNYARAGHLMWLAVVLLVLAPGAAFAADPTTPLGPIFRDIRGGLEIVLIALAGVVGAWLAFDAKRYLGFSMDEKLRASLQSAMVNGIHGALDRLQAGADTTSMNVRWQLVADAIPYVRSFAVDAVKRFGLTEQDLTALLTPQMAKILPPAAVSPAPSAT